jgi:hypothetical protein
MAALLASSIVFLVPYIKDAWNAHEGKVIEDLSMRVEKLNINVEDMSKPLQDTGAMPTAEGRRVRCRRPSVQANPTAAVGVAPSA